MAEVQAEAEKAMAELKGEAERVIASKDAEMSALKSELELMKSRVEKSEAQTQELERKIASLTEAKKREWQAEVVEPEIVSEEPPPTIRDMFKPSRPSVQQTTLADLERQAQAELVRMGASGAKKFFGLK
jgi:chromosome segregation ATPase